MRLFPLAALLFVSAIPASPVDADIYWTDKFTDNAVIGDGIRVNTLNNAARLNVSSFSDNDSGLPDISFGLEPGFHSISHGMLGGKSGFLKMTFINLLNDPKDYLETSITFDTAVQDLQFCLLDIDSEQGILGTLNNSDAVEVYFNGGINILTDSNIYNLNSNVTLDNETDIAGFESDGGESTLANTDSNLDLNFAGYDVTSVTIRYRGTDDAISTPTRQAIGISNLVFNSVPEPNSMLFMMGLGIAIATRRHRR
jgi:hypothetical protein